MRTGRLIALIVLMMPLTGTLTSAEEDLWQAYIEMKGGGSSPRWLGQGSLMLPLAQDRETLLFADLRGLLAESDAVEGNWGLAYRRILDSEGIFGVYAFYDLRHSINNNLFHQATVGAEYLTTDSGLRLNGYIPDPSVQAASGASVAQLQGNNILVRAGLEAAYWGFDFEAEKRLWCREAESYEGCGPPRRQKLRSLNAEFWATAGMFHFDHRGSSFRNITGPRVRGELRIFDLPKLGQDSRLVLTAQYEYDRVRGDVGTGLLTLRVPVGPEGCRPRLRGLNRRMVAPIIRDIDVITDSGAFGAPEQAKFANNDRLVSEVVTVNARDRLAGRVARAGKDSVVVVDGSAGDFHLRNTVALNRGQVVIGGGSQLEVIGCNSGARAVFTAGGTRPTVFGPRGRNDVFRLANRSSIIGIDTFGGRHGVSGRHVHGFTLSDLDIRDARSDGIRLRGRNGGDILDVDVRRNGHDGINIDSFGRGLISGNVARRNNGVGISIGRLRNATVSDNIARENRSGIRIGAFGSGLVTNNLAGQNRGSGFEFGMIRQGIVSNNLARNNRRNGYHVILNQGGSISNNSAIRNGRDGFNIDYFNAGNVDNNSAAENQTGFVLQNHAGGSFTNNSAEENQTGFVASFGRRKGPRGIGDPVVFSDNSAINNRRAGYLTRGRPDEAVNNTGSGNGSNDMGPSSRR